MRNDQEEPNVMWPKCNMHKIREKTRENFWRRLPREDTTVCGLLRQRVWGVAQNPWNLKHKTDIWNPIGTETLKCMRALFFLNSLPNWYLLNEILCVWLLLRHCLFRWAQKSLYQKKMFATAFLRCKYGKSSLTHVQKWLQLSWLHIPGIFLRSTPKKDVSKMARLRYKIFRLSIWQVIPNMGTRLISTPSKSHSPNVSCTILYQSPCPPCRSHQRYSRHYPRARSPWDGTVVTACGPCISGLFFTAAPLTFRPHNHSVAPSYRWNHQKLAQQPLCQVNENPSISEMFLGTKSIFFLIPSSETRRFAKTSSFCLLFISPNYVFFCFWCFLPHIDLGH